MSQLGRAFIEVRADLSKFPAELRTKLLAAMREGTAGVGFQELERKAKDSGDKAGTEAGKAFEKSGKKEFERAGREVGKTAGNSILSSIATTLGSRATILGGLISGAIGAGVALAPGIIASLAAIPTALTGIVALVGVLKASFSGVGDAVKAAFSGDSAKLAEALKGLAPAARQFVAELQAARPILHGIQQDIQQAFFVGFRGAVAEITTRLLPALRANLAGIGGDLGGIGRKIADVFSTPTNVAALQDTLEVLRGIIGQILVQLPGLAGSFVTLAQQAAPFVNALAGGLAGALQHFVDLVAKAAADGGLQRLFADGLDVLRSLSGLLASVGGILDSIISTFASGSHGLLQGLQTIVGALDQFFKTAAGQEALKALAAGLGAVANVIQAVVVPLLPLAGQLLTMLGGAVADTLGAAVGPLTDLATALSAALIPALQAAQPFINELASQLGTFLGQAIEALVPAIQQLAPAFLDLAQQIGPQLVPLAKAFGDVLLALVPIIPDLVAALVQLLPLLRELTPFFVTSVQAGASMLEFLAKLTGVVVEVTGALAKLSVGAFLREFGLLQNVGDTVKGALISAGGAISDFFTQTLPHAFDAVVGFVGGVVDKIVGALVALPGRLLDLAKNAGELFLEGIGVAIGLIIFAFTDLPGRILAAIQATPGIIGGFFTGMWHSITSIFSSGVDQVGAATSSLGGRISAAVHAIPGILADAFTSAWNFVRDITARGVNAVASFVGSLPGRVAALGPALRNAASNLGRAIGDGLASIGSFASDIGRRIVNTVRGGINSVIDSINRGIGNIESKLPISLPRLPHLARGGVVDRPTLAVIGEGGRREVVVPLTDPKRAQQLAEESGLLRILRQPAAAPVVNVTAILDGFGVMRIVQTTVDTALGQQGDALLSGTRAA